MAKLKNPLASLRASGGLGKALSFARRRGRDLIEKRPVPTDARSEAQVSWRTMFHQCVDLWHSLTAAEKAEWESAATPRHMTGYAWYLSQCLRPNPGIYLPLQGGHMTGDIWMDLNRILQLPAPWFDNDPVRKVDLEALEALYKIGARVTHGTSQSIANGVSTILAFNSERYDTDTIHDIAVSNSRLTCKTAGKYLIIGNVNWQGNATERRSMKFRLNATTDIARFTMAASITAGVDLILATIYDLAVNDFIEISVYQASGAPLLITKSLNFSPEFMMQRIG